MCFGALCKGHLIFTSAIAYSN